MGRIHSSVKATKEAADDREKVKDYVVCAVGSWISKSRRVW